MKLKSLMMISNADKANKKCLKIKLSRLMKAFKILY